VGIVLFSVFIDKIKRTVVRWNVSNPSTERAQVGALRTSEPEYAFLYRQNVSRLLRRNLFGDRPVFQLDNGWIHNRQELETAFVSADFVPAAIKATKNLDEQLSKLGCSLLVVPVPSRWELHHEGISDDQIFNELPCEESPSPIRRWYIDKIESEGVEVVDIYFLLRRLKQSGNDTYYKTDSHLTPFANKHIAELLASRIRSLVPELPESPQTEGVEGEIEITGDLLELLLPDRKRVDLPTTTVSARIYPEVKPDRRSPVLLLGDSFAFDDLAIYLGGENKRCGLPLLLADSLRHSIDWVAVAGGATIEGPRRLAKRLSSGSEPKVVIWMFSGSMFTYGDTYFPIVNLEAEQSTSVKSTAQNIENFVGRVVATDAPTLERVRSHIYPDLLATTIVEAQDQSPNRGEIELLVYVRRSGIVMLGNLPSPGETVSGKILEWDYATNKIEGLESIGIVGSSDRFDLPRYLLVDVE